MFDHYYSEDEVNEAKQNPVFLHFTASASKRPWIKGCKHPYKSTWDIYKRKTAWADISDLKDNRTAKKRVLDFLFRNLSSKQYIAITSLAERMKG